MAQPDREGPVDRGMRVLLARRRTELDGGAAPVGWKIGFNTPAIQEHFGLTEPVVGYLTDTGLVADGETVPLQDWAAPAVEVEVAIRVDANLGVCGLAPALELVDLGVPFDDIEVVLADNVCQRGVMFGPEVPGIDPWTITAVVTKTSGGDATTVGEGGLAEEPAATAQFVRAFLTAHDASLQPGDVIIAGSMVAPVSVAPGDELGVTFGPLGALRVRFS